MKHDLLEYLNYIKDNDIFLYRNYKNLFLFFQTLIRDEETFNIFQNLELENNKIFNYNTYNTDDLLNKVSNFFHEIDNDLYNEFNDNIKNKKIVYNESIEKSNLITSRDKEILELNNYIIEIKQTNKIEDCFIMIHEFTHYLVNKINKNKIMDKGIINIYDESIAIYSELLFYDFIKEEIGTVEVRKIIEGRLFDCFSQGADLYSSYNAINLICDNKSYDELSAFLNDEVFLNCFKYKVKNKQIFPYEHFIGTITALKLYFNKVNFLDLINFIRDDKINELDKILDISLDVKRTSLLFNKIINHINNRT